MESMISLFVAMFCATIGGVNFGQGTISGQRSSLLVGLGVFALGILNLVIFIVVNNAA